MDAMQRWEPRYSFGRERARSIGPIHPVWLAILFVIFLLYLVYAASYGILLSILLASICIVVLLLELQTMGVIRKDL